MALAGNRKREDEPPGRGKLKVFISYSRQKLDFFDRLQPVLEQRGIAASVDREDIEKSEAWWARIQQLITESDTIVFALSPGSVSSAVCQRKVDCAENLNKRFLPIVARGLAGLSVPAALARLNYIFYIANRASGNSARLSTNRWVRSTATSRESASTPDSARSRNDGKGASETKGKGLSRAVVIA